MFLRNPGAVVPAINALKILEINLGNVCGTADNYVAFIDAYVKWAEEAFNQYRSLFADDTLANEVMGARYYEVHRAYNYRDPHPVIDSEIKIQGDRLKAVIAWLTRIQGFVSQPGAIIVPDTSALTRGEFFTDFDWPSLLDRRDMARVILVMPVIDELDKLKWNDRGSARNRARRVISELRAVLGSQPTTPNQLRTDTTIEVHLDEPWHRRQEIMDDEIVSSACEIQGFTSSPVTLTCVDYNMEIRARAAGLRVVSMPTAEDVRGSGS